MKIRCILIVALTITLLAACQPGETQPVFTSAYGKETPIPPSTAKPKVAGTLPGRIRTFNIGSDMKTIAFATSQGVVLYDLNSYKHLQTLNKAESFYLVQWSPDGKKLAAGSLVLGSSGFGKTHLTVWDTTTWKIVFEQTGDDDTLDAVYGDIAWSPNSRSLATNLNWMGVLVYEVETGKVISRQETLSPHSIAWSPDGSRLVATGDLASGIRRWVVGTDQAVRLFDQRTGSSMVIAWSPDGKRIASGQAEGTVCFWTVATNKCDGLIKRAHQNAVFSLSWSPDGNQLATGGGIIRIWDSNTGKLIRSFGLNGVSIYTHLEWLGNKNLLVSTETGYADGALSMVRFWDVESGKVVFEFHGASGSWGE
jgi:WD40 repeat protein